VGANGGLASITHPEPGTPRLTKGDQMGGKRSAKHCILHSSKVEGKGGSVLLGLECPHKGSVVESKV